MAERDLGPKTFVVSHKRAGLGRNSPPRLPTSPIHKLIRRVQDYLYLPKADPFYVMLGAVVGNMMRGAPVWIVFVGPASSGKTVKLESLDGLKPPKDKTTCRALEPGVHIIGGIKGPAALLSGTGRKDTGHGATGGVLKEIGTRGIMVMKDFSTMLAINKDALGESIDALRQIFDGRYDRPLGTDGGKRIEWRGKIGFIAASTPAIDQHHKHIADLGERWMYYRYNASDGYGETIKALGVSDPDAMMSEMRALVTVYFEELGVEWDEPARDLEGHEANRIFAIAAFVTTARSLVPRNPYQHYEICDLPSREGPPRMATQLRQLYLGLERAGVEEEKRWELVGRVGWDSIKQSRARVIEVVEKEKVAGMERIRALTPFGKHTTEHMLEDLVVHGILETAEKTENVRGEPVKFGWRLTAWAAEHIEMGWGGIANGRGN